MERNAVDKVVLVTGATSGIGRAVALRFAESGARVVAAGRNAEALREVGSAIKSAGGEPLTIAADVTKEEDVRHLMQRAVGESGRLDVLVNAAGHIANGSVEDTALAAWDQMLDVNLRAVVHLLQLVAAHLIGPRGIHVNISIVTGLRSFPGVRAGGVP